MDIWNERHGGEHPDWVYYVETNFARDCTKARRRLLQPDYTGSVIKEVKDAQE